MTRFKFTPERPTHISINLTPMIDVVFILIVFFMLVSSFSGLVQLPVSLAGPQAQSSQSESPAIIQLGKDGSLSLDGEVILPQQLVEALQKQNHKSLIIKTAQGVNVQDGVMVLDAAREAGIDKAALVEGDQQQ